MCATELDLAQRTALETAVPSVARHYRRSWVDALIARIERVPGPTWLTFSAIAVGGGALGGALLIATNSLPDALTYRVQVPIFFLLGTGSLALIRHLNVVASARLDQFAPVLAVDAATLEGLRRELTVMPARQGIVVPMIGLTIISASYQADSAAAEFAKLPVMAQAIGGATELASVALFSMLIYHTVRQLRLVDRIHRMAADVDLFAAAPLHAFSGLTARTGAGLVAASAAMLLYPDASQFVSTWVAFGALMASAIAVFILPLRGIQRRLATEKGALIGAADRRLRATLEHLDRQVDGWDLSGADGLNKTLASQILQRDLLAKLPTWPWSTGTLRGFLSVLVVPIVLWLIQRALANLV